MKNLDQIRAHNALAHKDTIAASQGGGDAISGFPMLVLTDGLLAALAFACEWKDSDQQPAGDADLRRQITRPDREGRNRQQWQKRKHEGEFTVARAIAAHLHTQNNRITAAANADALVAELAAQDSDLLLRRATAEALAFLNYLKRFVA
ncbi:MAG: hypothetical protein JNM65_01610 [Verrucomicrobiaceae bacterium]|nr:hypothetical protein [Verrucomicrobiaceae bacterium]